MNYNNLDELTHDFISGKFKFPDEISVANIKYKFRSSSSYAMHEMVKKNYKGVIAYTTPKDNIKKAKAAKLDHWVMFLWGFSKNNALVPYDVRTMNMARGQLIIKEAPNTDDNFVGSTAEIKITNLPSSLPMKGKIDTGADISSLHATKWKIDNGKVHFLCPELSPNTITTDLIDQQAVKSADGGTEYRPVISLNIKINGKLLQNVQFNLNDRGKMTFPVLIGKNALQAGKFKIDPSLDENTNTDDIDWDYVQTLLVDDVVTEHLVSIHNINDLKQTLIELSEKLRQ